MWRILRKRNQSTVRLGRWSLSDKRKIADRKVELANIDHCGTCPVPLRQKEDEFDNSINISICALQSLHSYPTNKKN